MTAATEIVTRNMNEHNGDDSSRWRGILVMTWRKPTNLRDWLKVFARHKKKFCFSTLAMMIVVIIASHWIPHEYTAKASFQQEIDAATDLSKSDAIQSNLRRIRDTMRERLIGRPALEQLIYGLQLTGDLPHTVDRELTPAGRIKLQNRVKEIADKLVVRQQQSSKQVDQIVVFYTDSERELAPKIVIRLIENYIRTTRQELDQMLLNAKAFFEIEVARYRAKVNEMESQKLKFELDNPELLPENPFSVEAKFIDLRSKFDQVTETLVVLEQQRDQFEIMNGNFFARRNEYTKLSHDLTDASNQLAFWEVNLCQTMLALRAEVAHRGVWLSFIERVPGLTRASKPTFLGILSAAVVLGFGAGVGMIIATETLDRSFRDVDETVDQPKLPVFGAVSEIVTHPEAHRRRVMAWGGRLSRTWCCREITERR